jgi:adenylate kinase
MAEQRVIVLLAPPGGGKGTQAKKLVEDFDLVHISVGDVLREEVRKGSELGQKVKAVMDAGELVSDQLVGDIIRDRLQGKSEGTGFILDGYPRNVAQAEFLQSITKGFRLRVIHIDVEEREVIRRLSGRRFCQKCGSIYNIYFSPSAVPGVCDACESPLVHRSDDREDVIAERLKVYWEQTRPVVDFYRSTGDYFEVDGNWDPVDVFEELARVVRAA